jgi:hypothetical protein
LELAESDSSFIGSEGQLVTVQSMIDGLKNNPAAAPMLARNQASLEKVSI